MSTVHKEITAKTKTELRKLARQWIASAREHEFGFVEAGYDPERVQKTEDGYKINIAVSS